MIYKIVNLSGVDDDIQIALSYYFSISRTLASNFLFRLEEANIYLTHYPESIQVRYNNVRTLLLKQFPYHVHFVINESKKEVVILAILHAFVDPAKYKIPNK